MRFRPCIDLHEGKVKQLVGGTLTDADSAAAKVNFVSLKSSAYYAEMYRRDGLEGGHVILLGPGNAEAAAEALAAYPGGLQLGGGVNPENAGDWLRQGAAKVIVTSYVFRDGRVCWDRLQAIKDAVGAEHLVLDLSCRLRQGQYFIVTDRWQKFTDETIGRDLLLRLAEYCSEFLIHAVDVEGMQQGIDKELVQLLAASSPLQATYAGGIRSLNDLCLIEELGEGRIDATAGSSLDIFGGRGLRYRDAVAFDQERRSR
jgi:phosphoribosylformimino-5-aminoimidazole carboxamide ribotide isomerase